MLSKGPAAGASRDTAVAENLERAAEPVAVLVAEVLAARSRDHQPAAGDPMVARRRLLATARPSGLPDADRRKASDADQDAVRVLSPLCRRKTRCLCLRRTPGSG